MELIFATHNRNKLREIQQMCPIGIVLKSLDDVQVTEEIPETGATIEENSLIKAQFIYSTLATPCFADDSGLEADALGGAPGVHSARYAGEPKNDLANLNLLLKNLDGIRQRTAKFKTVITYIDHSGSVTQFTGTIAGVITDSPRGTMGFGYDPIFLPDGYATTFAEMPDSEKNTISHRAIAFRSFIRHLKNA